MPELRCPRCLSADVDLDALACRACRIAYDQRATFEYPSRQHTMVRARWDKWRSVDRQANETKRVAAFLGNG